MWSYLIIFLMVFIEGPVVTLIAGAMVGAGILRLDLAYAARAIGNFLADQFWYWLGCRRPSRLPLSHSLGAQTPPADRRV
ncbi:MAG: hypothetical protein IPK16_33255 [Anaerolineales bacterium]|nr:hypothetical protein [Anaerolineales bacterium]